MNPGRMRYRCTELLPGERSPVGDVMESAEEGASFHVDCKERDTSERANDERLTQARMFDVSARYRVVDHDARLRLEFGDERLDCAVVSVIQLPREGRTNLVLAHES